jgi:hypothetical protein
VKRDADDFYGYHEWRLGPFELTYFPTELPAYKDWAISFAIGRFKDESLTGQRVEIGTQMEFDVESDPNKVYHKRCWYLQYRTKNGFVTKQLGGL